MELRNYEAVFGDVESLSSEITSVMENAFKDSTEKNGHTNGCGNDQATVTTEPIPAERIEDLSNISIEGSLYDSQGALIWIDFGTCSYAVYSRVAADRVVLQQSPLALAKALKVGICLIMNL